MTVTFDQFLQMFPDDGFTTRRGAHRAFSTPESIAREGAAAREFYDWWNDAGQPALRGASTPPTLAHPATEVALVDHDADDALDPRAHELVGAGAPLAASTPAAAGRSAAGSVPLSGLAAPTRAFTASGGFGAANAAPAASAPLASTTSAPAAEPKLTGWSRFKHELTRKR